MPTAPPSIVCAAYVFDVGRSPTDIGLSSTSVAEKQPVGTVVGSFSTTDPYYPADPHTYTLVAGAGDTDMRCSRSMPTAAC